MYGSDPFTYDFEAALAAAEIPAHRSAAEPKAAGKTLKYACGTLAGAYAEHFWQNRRRNVDNPAAHKIVHHPDCGTSRFRACRR